MIGLPAGIGLAHHPTPPPTSVSFISATGAVFTSTGTSINTPLTPGGIANGDGLFAILFARSALTPPAGWTLVASQANTGTLTQTLYIYRKNTVTTADSSTAFTWTQASSGRMGLAYIVARSTSGSITVAANSGATTNYAVSTAYPQDVTIPILAATVAGELFLIATSAEAAGASGSDAWTAATGATRRTANTTATRLSAATQARNAGQSNASPMTFLPDGGLPAANYYSAITVRLQP